MSFLTVSLILVFLLIPCIECLGQNANLWYVNSSCTKQDGIHLTEGRKLESKNSNFNNGSLYCFASGFTPISTAAHASENSSVQKGAILGGIGGFVTGAIAGGIANSESNIFDLFSGDDMSESVTEEQVPYIVIGTLTGAAIGTLIGLKRRNTAFHKINYDLRIQPIFASLPDLNNGMYFTVRLKFN